MSQSQHIVPAPDARALPASPERFYTRCYKNAIGRLNSSFAAGHPLAILVGEGQVASSFVINSFLADLDDNVIVAQIAEPCCDATDLMQRIIGGVGFRPKRTGVADLEGIFSMFLSFQKAHGRRTVVCIEQIQDSDWWVLDQIRHIVELENENEYGLMVIISGQPSIKELLHKQPLSSVFALTGQSIWLAPFTLSETRDYIRRRVEAGGGATVDQQFAYQAIPLIHELTSGVPDRIATLLSACRDLADEAHVEQITTEFVKQANQLLRAAKLGNAERRHAETVTLNGILPAVGRLVVQVSGEDAREQALGRGHVLIGRSAICDIHIDRPNVSRIHALIVYAAGKATIVDLNSTNGTFVDGYRIRYYELAAGETIGVGDVQIEYIKDDDRQCRLAETGRPSSISSLHH